MPSSSISVIIPTYQCAGFIGMTLKSVLGQTAGAREVIVVDDGSTDDTEAVVKGFGAAVRYMRQANSGVAAARNRGLEAATSDWVMFLDADDVLEQNALELLQEAASGSAAVVYGDKTTISEGGEVLQRVTNRDCTGTRPAAARACFGGAAFEPGCAIVGRHLALQLGGFDQQYAPCEDRHFWVRCGALTEFVHVPYPVMRYRIRANSHSKDRTRQVRASVKTRIDLLAWFAASRLTVLEPAPEPADMLSADLNSVYWRREWTVVRALLDLADEYGLDSPTIQKVRRLNRIPKFVWRLKDKSDDLWRRTRRT